MRYNRFATEPKKKNTPGWSRKEDVQEKYDSGQVAQHEKELTELEAQVQELYGEFIDLFENEEDTLKKFIEETSSSDSKEEPKKEPELTPEDEYYIFLSGVNSQPPEFKNLNHKDTDSEAVHFIQGSTLVPAGSWLQHIGTAVDPEVRTDSETAHFLQAAPAYLQTRGCNT